VINGATAGAITQGATLTGALRTLNSSSSETTVRGIRDSLSLVNFAPVTGSLSRIDSELRELNDQTSEPILPPTLYTYYAAAVSIRARNLVTQMRDDALVGRDSLLSALNNAGTLDIDMDALLEKCRQNAQLARDLQPVVQDLLPIPGVGLVAYYLLGDLFLIESQYGDLIGDILRTQGEVRRTSQRVSQRMGELDDLIAALDFALSSTPLSSSWTTSADTGGPNAFYGLSFTGRNFTYPYTEIDDPFDLGTLNITNFITPGSGGTSLTATIVFSVRRLVQDPLLGPVETAASVSLTMNYNATTNDTNACGQSRDYFSIPALGINAYICETGTRAFEVYGRYDSPLRIVAIVPLPDSSDPDPAVQPFAYTLDVIGGTGSGVYNPGQSIAVSASTPSGRRFLRWDGDTALLDNQLDGATTLTMDAAPALITAVFEPIPIIYSLSVVNGTGGGDYEDRTRVPIKAIVPDGYRFESWTGDTFALDDFLSERTSALMMGDLGVVAQLVLRDDCPDDVNKDLPGSCGCGIPDVDSDLDGILDCIDACTYSDFSRTIMLGAIDSQVANDGLGSGCTMVDELLKAAALARNHGDFVSSVAHITNAWRDAGLISAHKASAIRSAAARSNLP
jgi:hypothetical protein